MRMNVNNFNFITSSFKKTASVLKLSQVKIKYSLHDFFLKTYKRTFFVITCILNHNLVICSIIVCILLLSLIDDSLQRRLFTSLKKYVLPVGQWRWKLRQSMRLSTGVSEWEYAFIYFAQAEWDAVSTWWDCSQYLFISLHLELSLSLPFFPTISFALSPSHCPFCIVLHPFSCFDRWSKQLALTRLISIENWEFKWSSDIVSKSPFCFDRTISWQPQRLVCIWIITIENLVIPKDIYKGHRTRERIRPIIPVHNEKL